MDMRKVKDDFVNVVWQDPIKDTVRINNSLKPYLNSLKEVSDRDSEIMNNARNRWEIGAEFYNIDEYHSNIDDGGDGFPDIITQFGTWAVTEFGVECLTNSYHIDADRLEQTDWQSHMSKKEWVNMADFVLALYHGRKIHRYLKSVSKSENE